jgi:hypothetical protein
MPSFGKKSIKVKATLNPYLQMTCEYVIESFDISLLEGRRGKERQNSLFDLKKTNAKWPNGKHNADENAPFPDNLSMAVDAVPWPIPESWGELKSETIQTRDAEWLERVKFYQMTAVFKAAWARVQKEAPFSRKYRMRFGNDWDSDNDYTDQTFNDLVHVELELI